MGAAGQPLRQIWEGLTQRSGTDFIGNTILKPSAVRVGLDARNKQPTGNHLIGASPAVKHAARSAAGAACRSASCVPVRLYSTLSTSKSYS